MVDVAAKKDRCCLVYGWLVHVGFKIEGHFFRIFSTSGCLYYDTGRCNNQFFLGSALAYSQLLVNQQCKMIVLTSSRGKPHKHPMNDFPNFSQYSAKPILEMSITIQTAGNSQAFRWFFSPAGDPTDQKLKLGVHHWLLNSSIGEGRLMKFHRCAP